MLYSNARALPHSCRLWTRAVKSARSADKMAMGERPAAHRGSMLQRGPAVPMETSCIVTQMSERESLEPAVGGKATSLAYPGLV